MEIRFIQSVGGIDFNYLANEKIKGKFVWYNVADFEAVNYIDNEIAIAKNVDEYTTAKANHVALHAQRKSASEIAETLRDLDSLKAELERKKEALRKMNAEAKALDIRIKTAEATIVPR
ncbi:MAG: hypothetical protein GY787_00520 [Alteromonadales bacterium]|nr:hypothetical protein [Alteromonadales bacterium]